MNLPQQNDFYWLNPSGTSTVLPMQTLESEEMKLVYHSILTTAVRRDYQFMEIQHSTCCLVCPCKQFNQVPQPLLLHVVPGTTERSSDKGRHSLCLKLDTSVRTLQCSILLTPHTYLHSVRGSVVSIQTLSCALTGNNDRNIRLLVCV